MRAQWILGQFFRPRTLAVLSATVLVLAIVVWRSTGQVPAPSPNPFDGVPIIPADPEKDKPAADRPARTDGPLPIRQVVLFNSGVGYFQREGHVVGNAHVDLAFPTSDINDLLKSLILEDRNGGKITSVNYDSHDPIDKMLHSFAIDLNKNPGLSDILNQARGESIKIYRSGYDPTVGTIVGLETKKQPGGKDPQAEVEMLNLFTENCLRSFPLADITFIRFLNPVLEAEFQRALRVLAASHDVQKKTVSLGFSGTGKREVRVGYVVEHPIWKTSYRLSIDQGGKVYIQGWAIVENTSDDDWNDVRMVLVSGRPISYKMNMYEPLYLPRPEVEPELFASLRPPVHGGAMINQGQTPLVIGQGNLANPGPFGSPPGADSSVPQAVPQDASPAPLPPPGAPLPPPGPGPLPGFGGPPPGYGGPTLAPLPLPPSAPPYAPPPPPGLQMPEPETRESRPNLKQGNKLTYDELQRRRLQSQQRGKARTDGAAIAGLSFKEGIASVANAEELGDYYQYVVDHKITLPRQKSALLPILDQTIAGKKVSIFNEANHPRFPLLGLKLKNSSGQPLSQGPITVYEDGSYAGDTRILDLQPGEERFLSYALDQAVEVKSSVSSSPSPDMNFKIGQASLTANYKLRQKKTYTIKNRAVKDRTVVIEHPIQGRQSESSYVLYYGTPLPSPDVAGAEWKLVEPKKPLETARDLYRFQVVVPAGKTITLDVVEEQARVDRCAVRGGQPNHFGDGGIQVTTEIGHAPPELVRLKIDKGLVRPTFRSRVSQTYFIQNLSDMNRTFTVDHIVSAGWSRLDSTTSAEQEKGPAVHRFVLEVPKGKTAQRQIVEERVAEEKGPLLRDMTEEAVRVYLANPAVDGAVKASLEKFLDMNGKMTDVRKRLAVEVKELDQLTEDQGRLRENLKIIPQTSEPYKKFLEKFVTQEGAIEASQKQIRELQAAWQTQVRELELSFGPSSAQSDEPATRRAHPQ